MVVLRLLLSGEGVCRVWAVTLAAGRRAGSAAGSREWVATVVAGRRVERVGVAGRAVAVVCLLLRREAVGAASLAAGRWMGGSGSAR